jgi:hypothetical protein
LKRLGVTQVDDPLIFVVASLCGGTGAGMFLDIGYMLTNLWKRRWTRFNTKVCALLALPSVFSDISQGTERIRSNAYASMKELDHFMNKDVHMDPERAFRSDYPYVERAESFPFAPFDRVFLFDNSNGRVSVSSAQVYEMMARYLYLLVGGELTQDYMSVDNNLNPKLRGTHRLLNKPTCYSSFGYYSVVFPKRIAVQVAAADLAHSLAEEELNSPADDRAIDERVDSFLTSHRVHFSSQSPQILHALSLYTDSSGQRANIQDVIGSTVANIDLGNEAPESYEAVVREYDTRFTNSELALFEAECRREAQNLVKQFRTGLEAEIQELADPARKGSVRHVHLFVEELFRELDEDAQALESLAQQTEKQIPGLKSALDTQFLKLRKTAASRSLFSRINLKKAMNQVLAETKETLESYWLARRKGVILRNVLVALRGEPQAESEAARAGLLGAVLKEREAYRNKVAALKRVRQHSHDLRHRRSVADGEFYKVLFDFDRDVKPVIEEVKQTRGGLAEARRKLHAAECLGSDLDGLVDLPFEAALERVLAMCGAFYEPAFAGRSLDERLAALGDLKTQVGAWLNFSRPFLMLDVVDASKYAFSEAHNAARFLAIPHTYVGKPCEQILNRCPVSSVAECDRYERCLKRSVLEALPKGAGVGHMPGRHEMHFLSLYHGITASSLIQLIREAAGIYRNHMLASEKIHMLGPVQLYDLAEPLPNKVLERLKDLFYASFACGSVVFDHQKETFLFRTDADVELKLPASVALGSDIASILDNYHSPQGATAQALAGAFAAMDRRLGERCKADARALGREVLDFVKSECVALDDGEKRRLFGLGQDLAEGRCSSI